MNILNYIKKLKKEDRVIFFLVFTTIGNILIAIMKFILSLTLPSLWFFINALFMIILSFARFFSIKDYNKIKLIKNKDEIKKIGYTNYLNNGILLIILGIMYFFVNVYIYYKGTNTTMHEYLTYLTALVAFWSISSALYGMIKYKRDKNPILKAVKLTNFANSLTSIMLTQIVLLDTYANTKVYNSNLMNGLTGIGISLIIIIIGLYMIIGINKYER
ncbi:MAG: cation transporter [Bacilli bacterium]|nr:cation transporter [Bacilli bacterium]